MICKLCRFNVFVLLFFSFEITFYTRITFKTTFITKAVIVPKAVGSRTSKDSAVSNMNSKFKISCITVFIVMCSDTIHSLVIETTKGPVRGKLVRKENVTYYAYLGIPYAEPPIGDLRFKPPVLKQSWTDVLNAKREGPVCPQAEESYRREQMSEDCLYLNIYVPTKKTQGALPALAYVHGGKFKSLSANEDVIYGPQLVLKRDVIFITINYRLGALGFLSLDAKDASGNAGIKDVQLALNWINNNIERFGGSRQQITLGGNSAGSALAHFLLLSEKSKDLFQRAILISGSALGYRFLVRHPKKNAIALAKTLGIMENSTEDILKQLKNVDAFDIVKAQQAMGNSDERGGFRPFAPFVPSIEIEYPEAFLTREPLDIIKDGIPVNVPLLVGFNAQEGLKMLSTTLKNYSLINELNENFERCIPSNIQYPIGSETSTQLAKSIQRFYFNDMNITNETLPKFINLITDTQFSYSIDSWIKYHKARSDSNTLYYYVFDFDGQLNFGKISSNISAPGTAHADELGYLFVTRATRARLRQLDQTSLRMLNIWLSITSDFIKYGNPTRGSDFSWMAANEKTRNHLHLNADPNTIHNSPIQERLSFWYHVYDKYYEYVRSGGPLEDKSIP